MRYKSGWASIWNMARGKSNIIKNWIILLDRANHLSQKLQIEIQKSQARFQQLTGVT